MAEDHTIKFILSLYRNMPLLKRLRAATRDQQLNYIKEVFEDNGLDAASVITAELRHRQNEVCLLEADIIVTMKCNNQESDAMTFKHIINAMRKSSDICVTPFSEDLLDLTPHLYFGRSCNIRLASLSFGAIIKNSFIRHSQIITSVVDNPIASFKLDAQRTMELYFLLNRSLHCMELKYKRDIDTKIIVSCDNASTRIYFQLLLSPKIFVAQDGAYQYSVYQQFMSTNISPEQYLHNEDIDVRWHRVRNFPGCSYDTLGKCTALELKLMDKTCPKDSLMSFFKELMERQYTITFGQFEIISGNYYTRRWKDMFEFVSTLNSSYAFNISWALKVLYSKGFIAIDFVENHLFFWTAIKKFAVDDPAQLELALFKVAGILDDDRYIDLYQCLLVCYADKTLRQSITEVENSKKIRACYVTPTRFMYFPPMDMLENRILVDYDSEYCLRVTYRDDDMTRINAANTDFYDHIIRSHISKSIIVHDREFEFLACSNSQLRTHGVWFYARDPKGNTATKIRSQLGDFSGIDCIATFVARMGQCFSTSVRAITSIKACGIEKREADIETEDKKYKFSDGTGRLSQNFARMLCENLHKTYKVLPSLFQIRYGGCKGTVSVDNTLQDNVIVIRDSMAKFKCEKDDLEIVKIAGPSPLHLNHQSIMLLEHHGIPAHVFLKLQESAIFSYLDMLLNETTAAKELEGRAPMGRPLSHRELSQAGLSLTTDPYFRKVLKLILHNSLHNIKCEGRIHLPTNMGRNLMGCMDEYAVLNYGEVHVKISPMKSDKYGDVTTITGPVIVTKFPAVHPGDMRRFEAVEKPELAHLVDCIVFPQRGHRPHPTEMAGSDLDGDEYFVTWLPEFLNSFSKENAAPLDYAPAKKLLLGRDIVATDMYQFISDYIKNDQLGKIANAHKAHADKEGLDSKKAVKLAEKFSVAVDFAKTGECPALEDDEKVVEYPDFMLKHEIATMYESQRALGIMYRNVCLLDDLLEQSVDANDVGVNWNQIKYCDIDRQVMEQAKKDYQEYCTLVNELMQLYGVQTEAELISGNVTQFHRRFMEKEDMFATSRMVKKRVTRLRSDFRMKFFSEFNVNPQDTKTFVIVEEMKVKAAAWHKTAYFEPLEKTKGGETVERILSFPWVVADVLAQYMKKTIVHSTATSQCISKITESLLAIYNEYDDDVSVYVEDAPITESQTYQQLIEIYPAILPLLFVLDAWCRTIRMSNVFPSVVEKLLKHLKIDDIIIDEQLIDAACSFKKSYKECYVDVIGIDKIGSILVNFMKKLGSQDFIMGKRDVREIKRIAESSDVAKLCTHALRAYFSLAVDNTCDKLVTIDSQRRILKKKLCKENTVVIPKKLLDDVLSAEKKVKASFERLSNRMDLDLREVSINKRRQNKRKVSGTLFFRGSHKTVQLLSRVASKWLKRFEKEEDGNYYFTFYKIFSEVRY